MGTIKRTGSFLEPEDIELIENWLGYERYQRSDRSTQRARSKFNRRLYPLLNSWVNGVCGIMTGSHPIIEADILDRARWRFKEALIAKLDIFEPSRGAEPRLCYNLNISKLGFEVKIDLIKPMEAATSLQDFPGFQERICGTEARKLIDLQSAAGMFWIDVLVEWTMDQIEALSPFMLMMCDELS